MTSVTRMPEQCRESLRAILTGVSSDNLPKLGRAGRGMRYRWADQDAHTTTGVLRQVRQEVTGGRKALVVADRGRVSRRLQSGCTTLAVQKAQSKTRSERMEPAYSETLH